MWQVGRAVPARRRDVMGGVEWDEAATERLTLRRRRLGTNRPTCRLRQPVAVHADEKILQESACGKGFSL
jgi:hypothetical protein